jgi:cell division protein FtsB
MPVARLGSGMHKGAGKTLLCLGISIRSIRSDMMNAMAVATLMCMALVLMPATGLADDIEQLQAEVEMLRASARRQGEIIAELKAEKEKLEAEIADLKGGGVVIPDVEPAPEPSEEESRKVAPKPVTAAELKHFVQQYNDRRLPRLSRQLLIARLEGRTLRFRGRLVKMEQRRTGDYSQVNILNRLAEPIKLSQRPNRDIQTWVWVSVSCELPTAKVAKLNAGDPVDVAGRISKITISRRGGVSCEIRITVEGLAD